MNLEDVIIGPFSSEEEYNDIIHVLSNKWKVEAHPWDAYNKYNYLSYYVGYGTDFWSNIQHFTEKNIMAPTAFILYYMCES